MGHLRAAEAATVMADMVGMERAMEYHLTANHYPPVPTSMVRPCIAAVEAAADDRWDDGILLPEGISFRGQAGAPVSAVIEQHHLQEFVNALLDEYAEEEE